RSFGLTVSESRCFDLLLYADLFKPRLRAAVTTTFDAYLAEAREQGRTIRAVTRLLSRYA
ncbi:MAG TPA: B12-binding domain-containing radical SAM protein, partial [Methanoregulaceae archaeon]|nr:B12-binding domain-containing radical SAM protein [Methanoregulaceae archaeon]